MCRRKKLNKKLPFLMVAITSLCFMSANLTNKTVLADELEPSVVEVPAVTNGTCRQNMLNTDSAVITNAKCSAIFSKNRTLTATYENLSPELSSGKIIAVLVDQYVAPGTAYMTKFLDEKNQVTFENIDIAVKLPQIHLYKQSPNDPDYLLRPENFIAKNMFPMSYVKNITNNGGLTNQNIITTYNGETQKMDDGFSPAGKPILYRTTIPNLYTISIPKSYFVNLKPAWGGLTPGEIFGVIIAEDFAGNPIQIQSVVSSDYYDNEFCRFNFVIPEGLKNFQFHIYKNILQTDNFLCKYLITVINQEAKQYGLST